jgi:hypothetical protein
MHTKRKEKQQQQKGKKKRRKEEEEEEEEEDLVVQLKAKCKLQTKRTATNRCLQIRGCQGHRSLQNRSAWTRLTRRHSRCRRPMRTCTSQAKLHDSQSVLGPEPEPNQVRPDSVLAHTH